MARDADADQKDQQNDRSRAACDRAARIRRGKSRRKGSPVLRVDRPSSPSVGREHFFNEIRQRTKSREVGQWRCGELYGDLGTGKEMVIARRPDRTGWRGM